MRWFQRFSLAEWLLMALILGASVMLMRAVMIQGIGYDAAFEMEAYRTVSDISRESTLLEAYDAAPITSEFYGVLTFQIAEAVLALGGRTMNPDDVASYQIHHALIALLAISGACAMGAATGVALRSRVAGLFTAALVLLTPLWLGMGAMNYKDVPVATGLSCVAFGLVVGLRYSQRAWFIGAVIFASVGAVLVLGTRAGGIALLGGLMGAVCIVALLRALWNRDLGQLWPTLGISGIAVAVGLTSLIISNPFARIDMLTWLRDSIEISRSYIWVGVIRTAGQDLPSDQLPWWYVPAWVGAQLPVVTSVLVAVGIGFLIGGLRTHGTSVSVPNRGTWVAMSPILIQGVALPMVVVTSGAVLYDGLRHLLFALPALLALGAIPLAWSVKQSRGMGRRVTGRAAVVGLSALALSLSLFACLRWFPYSYAFINPVAGAVKEPRAWELDFWGLTTREGIERLSGQELEPIVVIPAAETGRPFGAVTAEVGDAHTASTGEPHGVYVFRRWDSVFRQDWCTRLFTIERDGQILGEGGTCP